MDLNELELRRSIICDCGERLTTNEILPPININPDHRFYGGRAEKYAKCKCQICQREYIALINSDFEVFDTMNDKELSVEEYKDIKNNISNDKLDELVQDTVETIIAEGNTEETQETVVEESEENDIPVVSDGYVCPKCGKVCKSQAGLISHCSKCKNN